MAPKKPKPKKVVDSDGDAMAKGGKVKKAAKGKKAKGKFLPPWLKPKK